MQATSARATSAIVLVIDRLGAGWLGPYGNSWLETPNFNRLVAQSTLCETVLADSPELAASCRGYWIGRHAMGPREAVATPLGALARAAGATPVLLTDDSRVMADPLAGGFTERRILPLSPATSGAETIQQTGLFGFFDAARIALQEQRRPHLLWLHSRGMSGPWDAPLALRYQFADEEDPEPPDFVEPPEVLLDKNFDPDELLGYVHAYAGQVALADMCLGLLLDAIEEHPLSRETLLVVTSPRGYPLGEHRRVGPCDEALYGELLHVPLLLRFPGDEHALVRSQRILQPHELYSVVAETCGWQSNGITSGLLRELSGETFARPNVACAIGSRQRAIRTPAWFLRESQADESLLHELFAKPDDRWEANEVSSRCTSVVELLAAELDRFKAAAGERSLSESPPLADLLYDIWR
jgi:hypothetical protein